MLFQKQTTGAWNEVADVMKEWADDHPKARLMNSKRAAILQAAKKAFLGTGYDGTSMESIAREANVSIMTLYRHARSKDDLFAAVTASACEPVDSTELAKLEHIMSLPLDDALFASALHMQENLTREDSLALIRMVIAEVSRFPHLAELAYQGFIARLVDVTEWILSQLAPANGLAIQERRVLAEVFVDRLIGVDLLRALLGMGQPSTAALHCRATVARDEITHALADPGRLAALCTQAAKRR